jgi:FtsP/CotA-like multicopper oxidase with cupredoxin domain
MLKQMPGMQRGAGGSQTASDSARWTTVPMPAGLTMLPAEMELRPATAPYLPLIRGGTNFAESRPGDTVHLADGDTLRLTASVVHRSIEGRELTMFAFNHGYPGPLLSVRQGGSVVVDFVNQLDDSSSVHWHGIRLDNQFDGVPGLTQAAVAPGGHYIYRLRFPDAGVFWYHPHVREDIQRSLGLYGNILVRSPHADYFGPANREQPLVLEDLLVGDDGLVPFGKGVATHALMGRFGNVFLLNGVPHYALTARRGEVIRFFITNASSARTYNVSFAGARMKLVGGDAGNFEREAWVESIVIAPAERYIVHVRFDRPGRVAIVNRVRALDHLFNHFYSETDTLGIVTVSPVPADPDLSRQFDSLRVDHYASSEIDRYRRYFDRPVDRTLELEVELHGLPFFTHQLLQLDSAYFSPVEWGGTMPVMNWASTTDQVRWVLRDPANGRENMDIAWTFRRGEVIKLRLVNVRQSLHAMQHPIHLHGQRFLVLAVNGIRNEDLVWKDTVLVPAGATVDLLVDLSNPGRWMLHCHIAEHLAAQMMTAFTVE